MDFFQEAREMGILSVIGEPLKNEKVDKEKRNSYNKNTVIKYLSYVLPGANTVGMLIILMGAIFNVSNDYYTSFVISSVIFGLILGFLSVSYVFISKKSKNEKEISMIGVSSVLPFLAIMIVAFFTYLF